MNNATGVQRWASPGVNAQAPRVPVFALILVGDVEMQIVRQPYEFPFQLWFFVVDHHQVHVARVAQLIAFLKEGAAYVNRRQIPPRKLPAIHQLIRKLKDEFPRDAH
ncbi:MAG: hypothetical protein M5U05_06055 [Anaerolineales bacterium]|nr:hypothetical protein [Anaerolineales bacterium]